MIQRIQSLYLFLTALLTGAMLMLPLGKFLSGDTEYVLTAFGVNITGQPEADGFINTWYMGVLIVMATLLPLVNIFLFKKRMLQIRLCFMEIVFQIGILTYIGFYYYHMSRAVGGASTFTAADVFPLVGIILSWLAFRGIMKDELLIRSMNRIR